MPVGPTRRLSSAPTHSFVGPAQLPGCLSVHPSVCGRQPPPCRTGMLAGSRPHTHQSVPDPTGTSTCPGSSVCSLPALSIRLCALISAQHRSHTTRLLCPPCRGGERFIPPAPEAEVTFLLQRQPAAHRASRAPGCWGAGWQQSRWSELAKQLLSVSFPFGAIEAAVGFGHPQKVLLLPQQWGEGAATPGAGALRRLRAAGQLEAWVLKMCKAV